MATNGTNRANKADCDNFARAVMERPQAMSDGPTCAQEEWRPPRVIAYLDHPIIARATFRAAVEQYPKARIRLRNRALVTEEHKPK